MSEAITTSEAPASATPEEWAIVELMGHVRLAGRVSEEQRFGATLGRIDVPTTEGEFMTKFFSGASIYCVSPVTEAVARHVAAYSHRSSPLLSLPSPVLDDYDQDDYERDAEAAGAEKKTDDSDPFANE